MALGYDDQLFILAFDHRGSFKQKFGVTGDASPEQLAQLQDAKRVVWEGFQRAVEDGAPKDKVGVLVDEEMGSEVAREARERGFILAMPVEKSGQDTFDFEYGDDFGQHIEDFDPTFSKVLVRWNPGDDTTVKRVQANRLARLGSWLHEKDRRFLFELLVPANDIDLTRVQGDKDRYDAEIRPGLTMQSIREIQELGVEPDIWKIEGLDRREDCEELGRIIRLDGRSGVIAVVLGRGADDAKVDHWLTTGAPVEAYDGFAIGRSIWSDAVAAVFAGATGRDDAAAAIGASFRRFIDVYQAAERGDEGGVG